jgi:1-phosphofructokinase family hexose kinase
VAAVARRLGIPVELLAPLGGATGDEVRARAEADGIPVHVIRTRAATRRTVTVVAGDEHPTGLYEPPARLERQEWRELADRALATDPAGVVVVSGRTPPGVEPDDIGELVDGVRRRGGRVVADTSGPALVAAARAGAAALKPNASELAEATGEADWRRGARRLVDAGAGLVLVSLGPAGLAGCGPRRIVRARGISELTGNPTGAGDAVVAALAAGLLRSDELGEIMRACAATGAAAVLQPTAGMVDLDDVDRLRAGVTIEEEPWDW